MFPECIHIRDYGGFLPIHLLIGWHNGRDRSKILRFLLEYHPVSASEPITAGADGWGGPDYEGRLALHLACIRPLDLDSLKIIFNAYPEAINIKDGKGNIPSRYLSRRGKRKSFMSRQLDNAIMAKDMEVMMTHDSNDMLPLHTALCSNECLGGIKLLVKGYPGALLQRDDVVDGLYPLHFACRFGSIDNIKYLLKEEESVVSKRTYDGKLPVHILCEAPGKVIDLESPEYIGVIWSLLVAYPEAVMTSEDPHCS